MQHQAKMFKCREAINNTAKWNIIFCTTFNSAALPVHGFLRGIGEPNHSEANPFRTKIRGDHKRKRLAVSLRNSRAKVLKRKLLARKASTKKGKDDLEAGNFSGVPTSGALRTLAYEDRKKNRLDDDPFLNLSKNASALNVKYGEGSVFLMSEVPLKVAWATHNQLHYIHGEAAFHKCLGAYLDSTGSEAKPASFDVSKKSVFTYNLCLKREEKGNPPIPVSTCVMNDHHEYEISHWLSRLRTQYGKVTGSSKLPFKFIVTDLSRALTNACVLVLNGMSSLIQYLYACQEAKQKKKISFVLVLWCYAHLIGTNKRKICELVPRATLPMSPARGFANNFIARLSRTSEVDDAVHIFKLAVIITVSKHFTDFVKKSVDAISVRLGTDVIALRDEDLPDEDLADEVLADEDLANEDLAESIEDAVHSSLVDKYQDSPFYKIFKAAYDCSLKEVQEDEKSYVGETPNPLYVPMYPTYLLQHLLPFYPLWSLHLQSLLLPCRDNPLSNSPSENMHFLDKKESLGDKLFQEVTKVMLDLVEGAEERLLEVKYPTDFTKYRKRNDKEEATINVPKEEKWKRGKRKRVPGGLYSSLGTSAYGAKLSEKVRRAAAKMMQPKHSKRRKTRSKKSTSNTFVVESMDLDEDVDPSVGAVVELRNIDDGVVGNVPMILDDQSGVGAADLIAENGIFDGSSAKSAVEFLTDSEMSADQTHSATISTIHLLPEELLHWYETETPGIMITFLPDNTEVRSKLCDLQEGNVTIVNQEEGVITSLQFVPNDLLQNPEIPVDSPTIDLTDGDRYKGPPIVKEDIDEVEDASEGLAGDSAVTQPDTAVPIETNTAIQNVNENGVSGTDTDASEGLAGDSAVTQPDTAVPIETNTAIQNVNVNGVSGTDTDASGKLAGNSSVTQPDTALIETDCEEIILDSRRACLCTECGEVLGENSIHCTNCTKVVHASCSSGQICKTCSIHMALCIGPADIKQIRRNEMLTDIHFLAVNQLLKIQFPLIDGLHSPATREEELRGAAPAYLPYKGKTYVQFMSTGGEHWVACIIQKGKVNLLNSSGSPEVTSFVEQQVAQILACQKNDFLIHVRATQTQEDGINECGPLAIAFVVDFLNSNELLHNTFDITQLRPHLEMCLVNQHMTPFPKSNKNSTIMKIRTKLKVSVYCTCRMPEHFGKNMIYCEKCKTWFHYECQNLVKKPAIRHWLCCICAR